MDSRSQTRLTGPLRRTAEEEAHGFRHDVVNVVTTPNLAIKTYKKRHPLRTKPGFEQLRKLCEICDKLTEQAINSINAVQIFTPETQEYIKNYVLARRMHELQENINEIKETEERIARNAGIPEEQLANATPLKQWLPRDIVEIVKRTQNLYLAPHGPDTEFSLNRLVRQLRDPHDPNFHVKIPDTAINFKGNRQALLSALNEIIMNANLHPVNFYTKAVEKHVSLEIHEDTQGRWARITIKDSGTGMTREQLFKDEEYFRTAPAEKQQSIPAEDIYRILDKGVTYRTGGTGFGLHYTNNVIKAHFGRIRIDSTPYTPKKIKKLEVHRTGAIRTALEATTSPFSGVVDPDVVLKDRPHGTTFIIDLPLQASFRHRPLQRFAQRVAQWLKRS